MIFKILITGMLSIFITGELFRFNLENNIYLKPLDGFVVLSAAIFWTIYIFNKTKPSLTKINKPLIIFSIIGILSLLINSSVLEKGELFASFLYWLRFVSFATIYFLILSVDKSFIKKIFKYLFISAITILFLGLVQYVLYPNLQNLYYLGWDEHTYRLFSVFLDPNFAGSLLSLFLFFLLGAIVYYQKKQKINYVRVLTALSFLTSISVFLTYSRSAILMFITGVVVYLFMIKKKRFLILLFGFVFMAVVLMIPGISREGTNLFRTTSTLARLDSYDNAIKIIKDKPVLGVGFNAYRYAQENRGYLDNLVRYPKNSGGGVDSSLLFVAATTGLVGLVLYIYLWYAILKRAYDLHRRNSNAIALAVICSIAGLSINSLFINSLFYPSIMLWMWVLIALMERKDAIPY